jgi:gliding motility associated protien GldN
VFHKVAAVVKNTFKMSKIFLGCLLFVSSMGWLLAQTEAGMPANTTAASWLDGGAGDAFMASPPLPYPVVREADILWEKRVWRVIDTREKINLPFRHPDYALFDVLAAGLKAGALRAYSPADDQFTAQVAAADIWQQLESSDTVGVVDPETNEWRQQIVTNVFDPERIKRWRVQEVWYFDARHSTMQVRIVGIAPLLETAVGGESGTTIETPLFWVNYAEARPWLAQHPAPQWGNDRMRMSWEDLFAMRRFHGYITQERDMRGRRLQDYASGRDLLLESEKRDQAIQNWEHDVWSY